MIFIIISIYLPHSLSLSLSLYVSLSLPFSISYLGTLTQNKMTAIRAYCPGMEDGVLLISEHQQAHGQGQGHINTSKGEAEDVLYCTASYRIAQLTQ